MSNAPLRNAETNRPPLGALEFRLLGSIDFDLCLQLQDHLVRSTVTAAEPRIVVLLAEHSRMITVGRRGSRAHIRMSEAQLRRKQLALRWVARGGGCVLHGPGQLAIYPLVPLAAAGWRLGDYLGRFRAGIVNGLEKMGVPTWGPEQQSASDRRISERQCDSNAASLSEDVGADDGNRHGIWGRSGRLAAFGVAVRDGVSCFGAYLNVNPAMADYPYVGLSSGCPPAATRTPVRAAGGDVMGSLLSERKYAGRMTLVRTHLVQSLGEAFDAPNYHLYTGHPYVARLAKAQREPARSL